MPAFLEVQSGLQAGHRIRLDAGQTLRIGRTSRADVVFAEDSHMSGVHFSLVWEGANCRVTDLDSRNGVLVNGAAVRVAWLRDGDTIVAGETTFSVRIEPEQETDGTSSCPTAEISSTTPQERALTLLRRDMQPLFAILDAARDIRILALLVHYKAECQSLYEGVEGGKLAHVSPYLVRLAPDSPLLEPLVKEGWGKSWGVYLTCDKDFHEVRRHLRHFLEVKLPDGEPVYFRFYDPRVMRIYLPACAAAEADQFFGLIKRYVMEGEEPNELWEFTTMGRGAEKRVLLLAQPTAGGTEPMSAEAHPGPPTLLEKPGPEGQE